MKKERKRTLVDEEAQPRPKKKKRGPAARRLARSEQIPQSRKERCRFLDWSGDLVAEWVAVVLVPSSYVLPGARLMAGWEWMARRRWVKPGDLESSQSPGKTSQYVSRQDPLWPGTFFSLTSDGLAVPCFVTLQPPLVLFTRFAPSAFLPTVGRGFCCRFFLVWDLRADKFDASAAVLHSLWNIWATSIASEERGDAVTLSLGW